MDVSWAGQSAGCVHGYSNSADDFCLHVAEGHFWSWRLGDNSRSAAGRGQRAEQRVGLSEEISERWTATAAGL